MKKNYSCLLVSVLVLPLILSCVTKTNVTFYTDQDGADVYVDEEYIGKTPVTKNRIG